MTKLATRPTIAQSLGLGQRFTVGWTSPSGVIRSLPGQTVTRVEGVGRLLLSNPHITDIEVIDENGDDVTFDFEFACR